MTAQHQLPKSPISVRLEHTRKFRVERNQIQHRLILSEVFPACPFALRGT
jgi:hypothetical protein